MQKFMKVVAAIMLTAVFVAGCGKDPDNNNGKPAVMTSQVSDITGNSARGGGVITSDASLIIIERGVCWGTQANPDVSGNHAVAEGIGAGSFTCVISGLEPNTTYHVRAYAINSVGVGYGDDVSFSTEAHGYVDLGLPSGTLWATCNVGATIPEGYGDYFSWGETEPKSTYNWSTYKYCNGVSHQLTLYCSNSSYGYNGFTDNLTILQPSDDAATANWGEEWRMPTKEQWEELCQKTTNIWTSQNGVNGRLFTSSNGNSLFLPAADYRWDDERDGSHGCYWSNSLYSVDPRRAWNLSFFSSECDMNEDGGYRYGGISVRPVRSVK